MFRAMSSFLTISFFCVAILVGPTPALAESPVARSDADSACRELSGRPASLCRNFCDFQECDTENPLFGGFFCGLTKAQFEKATGGDQLPCLAECPCDFRVSFWANPTWNPSTSGSLFDRCEDAVRATTLSGFSSNSELECNFDLLAEEGSCTSTIVCFARGVQFPNPLEIQGEVESGLTDVQASACRDDLREVAAELALTCTE